MRAILLLFLLVCLVGFVGGIPAVVGLWALVALLGIPGGLYYKHKIISDYVSDLNSLSLPPAIRCRQCGHNLSKYSEGECPTCGLAFRVVDK